MSWSTGVENLMTVQKEVEETILREASWLF
jgi:hypothetical protein